MKAAVLAETSNAKLSQKAAAVMMHAQAHTAVRTLNNFWLLWAVLRLPP